LISYPSKQTDKLDDYQQPEEVLLTVVASELRLHGLLVGTQEEGAAAVAADAAVVTPMTLLAGRGLRTDGTLVVVVVVVVVRLLIHFNRDSTKPTTTEDFSSASFYCR
jgi:hypothetical protein